MPTPVASWMTSRIAKLIMKFTAAAIAADTENTSGGTYTFVRMPALLTIADPEAITACAKYVIRRMPDSRYTM